MAHRRLAPALLCLCVALSWPLCRTARQGASAHNANIANIATAHCLCLHIARIALPGAAMERNGSTRCSRSSRRSVSTGKEGTTRCYSYSSKA